MAQPRCMTPWAREPAAPGATNAAYCRTTVFMPTLSTSLAKKIRRSSNLCFLPKRSCRESAVTPFPEGFSARGSGRPCATCVYLYTQHMFPCAHARSRIQKLSTSIQNVEAESLWILQEPCVRELLEVQIVEHINMMTYKAVSYLPE
jgi:hypothetical protein